MLCALCHGAVSRDVEKWGRWLRLGRDQMTACTQVVTRADAVARALRDGRGMRDSRLHALLSPLEPETVLYLYAGGDVRIRERVARFSDELWSARPSVSGDDLVAMGLTPSQAFSGILARALADRLDGKVVGREAELSNLRRLAIAAGLDVK